MVEARPSICLPLAGLILVFASPVRADPIAYEDIFAAEHASEACMKPGRGQASGTSCGPTMLRVKSGQYQLQDTIYNAPGNLWLVPPNAGITGGLIEGNTDGSTILPGHEGIALIGLLKRQGGSTLFVSNAVDGRTNFASYEADGIYSSVATADPSTTANHDMVAGHFASKIDAGNPSGRAWGQDVTVTVPVGADGYAVGEEIGIGNDSQTTGSYGQTNAKLGLSIIAAGRTDSTAGLLLHDAGARFVDGLLIFTSAIRRTVFRLTTGRTDLATINADGSADFAGLTVTGPIKLMTRNLQTLPTRCEAGQEVFVSDGRNPGEATGQGSGTVAFCNRLRIWLASSTGHAVVN